MKTKAKNVIPAIMFIIVISTHIGIVSVYGKFIRL